MTFNLEALVVSKFNHILKQSLLINNKFKNHIVVIVYHNIRKIFVFKCTLPFSHEQKYLTWNLLEDCFVSKQLKIINLLYVKKKIIIIIMGMATVMVHCSSVAILLLSSFHLEKCHVILIQNKRSKFYISYSVCLQSGLLSFVSLNNIICHRRRDQMITDCTIASKNYRTN